MIDLHTHSTFSDGTFSPTELIELAEQTGLSAIALCDHNTVSGIPEFLKAAQGRGVEAVPGIEFSTDYEGTELHILGLFLRIEHLPSITALLKTALERKFQSNVELVEALNRAGYAIDFARISAETKGYINRAHIAAALLKAGYVKSVQEAFRTLLSPEAGYYKPPKRLDAFETIRFIRSIGAVAVLAHPFLNLDEPRLRAFLAEAVPCGLNGMETEYPLFSAQETELAHAIAAEFAILCSGGSDFHGENKPYIRLGVGKGRLSVPDSYLDNLRQQAVAGKIM